MHEVIFSPDAEADLFRILLHGSKQAPRDSLNFVEAIRSYCEGLSLFPHRGADRSDIRPKLRTVPYSKRATIVFTVEPDLVTIIAVAYAGRDVDALLDELSDEV